MWHRMVHARISRDAALLMSVEQRRINAAYLHDGAQGILARRSMTADRGKTLRSLF
jgi:hypothetical protein